MTIAAVASVLSLAVVAAPAAADATFFDFDDLSTLPANNGIPANFYAPRGLTDLSFTSQQVGVHNDGRLMQAWSLTPPGSGYAISAHANLAGWLADFQMTFSQPKVLLTVDAFESFGFAGQGPLTLRAYNGATLVGSVSYAADPSRVWLPVRLQVPLATPFTRVVFDLDNNSNHPDAPNFGPVSFDNLVVDTVPAPGTFALLAGVGLLAARRRR
jgi:MYXO-CTERM domain-containing protein